MNITTGEIARLEHLVEFWKGESDRLLYHVDPDHYNANHWDETKRVGMHVVRCARDLRHDSTARALADTTFKATANMPFDAIPAYALWHADGLRLAWSAGESAIPDGWDELDDGPISGLA